MSWLKPQYKWRYLLVGIGVLSVVALAGGVYFLWGGQKNTPPQETAQAPATQARATTQEDRAASLKLAQGDTEGAAQIYLAKAQTVEGKTEKAQLYMQAAQIYVSAGSDNEALQWAQKSYDTDGPNAANLTTLAALSEKAGQYDEAIQYYQKYIELLKQSDEAQGYIKDYEARIQSLEEKK